MYTVRNKAFENICYLCHIGSSLYYTFLKNNASLLENIQNEMTSDTNKVLL